MRLRIEPRGADCKTQALPARDAPSWRTVGIAIAGSAVDAAGVLQGKQRGLTRRTRIDSCHLGVAGRAHGNRRAGPCWAVLGTAPTALPDPARPAWRGSTTRDADRKTL